MKKILIFLLGLLALGVLGYVCLYSKATNIQYEISQRVQGGLADERFKHVKANVDGRDILLEGTVESNSLKEQAEKVSKVEGYYSINNQISVSSLNTQSPRKYELSLKKSSMGDIVLMGDVPDSNSRHHFVAQAMEKFGVERVQDRLRINKEMQVAQAESLADLLVPLGILDSGKILLNNEGVSIVGSVDSQEKKDQLSRINQNIMNNSSDQRQYSQQISIITPLTPSVLPQPQAAEVENLCQKEFDALLANTKINFQTSTSVIEKSSYTLLDDLLVVVKKCHANKLTIRGHTDSTGSDILNKKISEQRANAVMTYFINKGVERDRLTALGMGESEPIANNSDAEGRALNRRIDFMVEREK